MHSITTHFLQRFYDTCWRQCGGSWTSSWTGKNIAILCGGYDKTTLLRLLCLRGQANSLENRWTQPHPDLLEILGPQPSNNILFYWSNEPTSKWNAWPSRYIFWFSEGGYVSHFLVAVFWSPISCFQAIRRICSAPFSSWMSTHSPVLNSMSRPFCARKWGAQPQQVLWTVIFQCFLYLLCPWSLGGWGMFFWFVLQLWVIRAVPGTKLAYPKAGVLPFSACSTCTAAGLQARAPDGQMIQQIIQLSYNWRAPKKTS